MNNPHLTPEEVAAYIDGRLTPLEMHNADRHLVDCQECQTLLANTVKTIKDVTTLRIVPPKEDK